MEPKISLETMLGSLRRRRLLVIGIVLAGTLAATLVGLKITPRFTATALLLIEPHESSLVDIRSAPADTPPPDPAVVETQINMLGSLGHARRVMTHSGLDHDLEFRPEPVPANGAPWHRLVTWLPRSWLIAVGVADELPPRLDAESRRPAAPAPEPDDDARLQRFAARFKVVQEGRSNVVGVSFTSSSPEKAAAVANTAVELYVQDRAEQKRALVAKAAGWLGERVATLKGEVARAEAAVEAYRAANQLVVERRTDVVDQQVADISKELIAAQADLSGRQARLAFIGELRRRRQALDTLPEVLASPVVVELRQREAELSRQEAELATTLGRKHPSMRLVAAERQKLADKLDREIDRIVANLENEANIAASRLEATRAALAEAQRASARAQTAELRLRELEREAEADRKLYAEFLQRFKEVREQQELVQANARVVSSAMVPARTSSPGPKVFAAAGFAVSTALSAMLALFLDQIDQSLRSAADLQNALGLRRVGFVPRLRRWHGGQRPHEYLLARPRCAYAEAMRAILVALRLEGGGNDARRPKLILITSSVPDEGKTVLAVSLASYAASSGRRVALLDLDLRHPSVARELQLATGAMTVQHEPPGVPLAKVSMHAGRLDLDVLLVRGCTDPMPLLASPELGALLRELREGYDHVFVDCSPVLGITDAQLLAPLVDKVLFVVQWGRTARTLARSAVDMLHDARADIAGAVLTQVDVKKHSQYRYGDIGDVYQRYAKYYEN